MSLPEVPFKAPTRSVLMWSEDGDVDTPSGLLSLRWRDYLDWEPFDRRREHVAPTPHLRRMVGLQK